MFIPSHPSSPARASLAQRIQQCTRQALVHQPPALPSLMMFRNDQPYVNNCGVYEPCVAVIVQGCKRVMLGEDTLVYGPDRYLIASMDLPVKAAVIEASPEHPYLAVGLRLDWREIATLMQDLPKMPAQAPGHPTAQDHRAMATGALTEPLLQAFDRLLALLDQPEHIPALAPLVTREIYYRLLVGEAGPRLRQMATLDSHSHTISRAMARLNARFAEPLRVDDLARELGMSVTSFHHHFKALTAMSPLQYQKQLRLHESRRLMLAEGLDAATAAFRVGYESPSQFSREYSRQFGAPPSRDIAELRHQPMAAVIRASGESRALRQAMAL